MASYVIVPRRGLYCIEAIYADGERRAVESHRDEKAAVRRLSDCTRGSNNESHAKCSVSNRDGMRPSN